MCIRDRHHPEEGYYSTAIENIGMRGDFSTTPTLSPILAKAIIARWKEACARCGTRLPLLEIGAGSGALAVKIMDQLGFWNRLNTCLLYTSVIWCAMTGHLFFRTETCLSITSGSGFLPPWRPNSFPWDGVRTFYGCGA